MDNIPDSEKVTPASVNLRRAEFLSPYRCAGCTMFESPDDCTHVRWEAANPIQADKVCDDVELIEVSFPSAPY